MGLYGFKAQFVPFILSGEKSYTIRAIRANPDKPGNTVHLYTGLRRKGARLLMRAPCVKVEEIEIKRRVEKFRNPDTRLLERVEWYSVTIDGHELCGDEREALARRDGFSSFAEMMKFWQEPEDRLPFFGHIIHWRKKRSSK